MPLNDWEYSYNGLTFGGNNVVGVLKVDGLSMPDVRVDDLIRTADHGEFIYANFLGARTISIQGDIFTSGTIETSLDAIRGAFIPQLNPLALNFKFPNAVEKKINCVPTRLNIPVDAPYQIGDVTWDVMLLAGDPRIYAATQTTNTIALTSGSGSVANSNAGVFSTPPTLVFTGPGTTFRATNNTTSEFLQVNTTLTGAQSLTIDVLNKTILRNDGTNLYGSLDTASTWWVLGPGSTTVAGAITSGFASGSQLQVKFNSAWL